MLMRMYLRWAERNGFKASVTDEQEGEGAGIKNATIEVEGENVFGLLGSEIGVHRLVRISPFDANARRHTSFASVFIYPMIEDDVKIEIKPDDLKVDVFRASGAGGQHVNRTESAVRMTHLPTGIVVQCQNERSQHKNRASALKQMRARLYEHEMDKRRAEEKKLEDSKSDINFGSQIRSYVLAPYRMIKDHRTKLAVGDVDRVLDGDLSEMIHAFLVWKKTGKLAATPKTTATCNGSANNRRGRPENPLGRPCGFSHGDGLRPGGECAGCDGGAAHLCGKGAAIHESGDRACLLGGDGAPVCRGMAGVCGRVDAAPLARPANDRATET